MKRLLLSLLMVICSYGMAVGQPISGGGGSVSDATYGAGWSGVTDTAPSKNATYNKIQTLAPVASPTFTGTVTAPIISVGTLRTAPVISTGCTGYLKNDGTCDTPAGTGDVAGPSSATADGNIVLFNGTGGKTVKDSTVGLASYATLASPTFTGTVTVPIMSVGTISNSPTFVGTVNGGIAIFTGTIQGGPIISTAADNDRGETMSANSASFARCAASAYGIYAIGTTLYLCVNGTGVAVPGTGPIAALPSPTFTGTVTVPIMTIGTINGTAATSYVTGPASPTVNQLAKFSATGPTPITNSTVVEDGTDINIQALNLVTTGYTIGRVQHVVYSTSATNYLGTSPLTVTTDRVMYGGIIEINSSGTVVLAVKVTGHLVCLVQTTALASTGALFKASGTDFIEDMATIGAAGGTATLSINRNARVCVEGAGDANKWRVIAKDSNGVTVN